MNIVLEIIFWLACVSIGVGFFYLLRCLIALRVNDLLCDMSISEIDKGIDMWYCKWNVTDFVFNPLQLNQWTAKSVRKYLKELNNG